MSSKILYWFPRILAIFLILIMLSLSFDSFDGIESFGMKFLGFLVHNIPALILIVILIVAWKWEVAGGILFLIASVFGAVFFHSFTGNPGSLIIVAPFLLTGLLFILHDVLYPASKNE